MAAVMTQFRHYVLLLEQLSLPYTHVMGTHRASNGAPVHRNPGMALVYSESPFNVPPVFTRLVESWGLHSIVVFMTVHQVRSQHPIRQRPWVVVCGCFLLLWLRNGGEDCLVSIMYMVS